MQYRGAKNESVGRARMGNRNEIFAIVAALAGAAVATSAGAQSYPDRPIEITVPFSPGAVTDVLGRALAEGLTQQLGQRVLVINKAVANRGVRNAGRARAGPGGSV